MKHITYLIAALSIIVSSGAFAQSVTNRAMVNSCGGGLVSSGAYAGSIWIGLPFVGKQSTGDLSNYLGLYLATSPRDTTMIVSPTSFDFGSISGGHSASTSFTISNRSSSGVSI